MKFSKALLCAATSVIVALAAMAGIPAAGETPVLQFRNEKVTGLTVTKEIYRTASDTQPLRQTDSAFYAKNALSGDEFRLYLLEGSSEGNVSPKKGEQYTRMNQYGNYYCCQLSEKTLIIRPTEHDYEVYYYDDNGKKKVYEEETEHTSARSDIAERFQEDYNAQNVNVSRQFGTGENGEFYLYDGDQSDQVYFKQLKSNYYYIAEDTELLRTMNDKKSSGVYKTDITALSAGNPALLYQSNDANLFEVHNYFDRPHDAFTIKKAVNYFGGADLLNEEFTFELLINEENAGGYPYTVYAGDSEVETGILEEDEADVPTVIRLKGNQRMEITGLMKNTYIEVRELLTDAEGNKLNPHYSPLTVRSSEEGKAYTLVTEGHKKYIRWEGNYIKGSVDTAEYVNVPNVMAITKTVTNAQELSETEEYEFVFHITKLENGGYTELAENKQLRYYLRSGFGTPCGDSTKNGAPFLTENGSFKLHHGETALFVGLEPDEQFRITETGAFYQGNSVAGEFRMDKTVYDKKTRPETVTAEVSQVSDGEIKEFRNTYDRSAGLSVTKVVQDDYGRSNPDAEYRFRILKQNGDAFYPVSFNGKIKVTVNGEIQNYEDPTAETPVLKSGDELFFTLKQNETAHISSLANGKYRVEEINPNIHNAEAGTADTNPQDEPHLFVSDVMVNGGDIHTFNAPPADGSAIPRSAQTDVTSEQFELSLTDARSVTFTNKVRELKYYFDIEKIIFVDQNIHERDTEQKFVFKVERFAEGLTADQLTEDHLLECSYVTLNCDTPMCYREDNILLGGYAYPYSLYHKADKYAYPYAEFSGSGENVLIKKTYYRDGSEESYQYPAAIWNGRQTVMVKKKGIYRISEVKECSATDYDFWKGSNVYKGYGEENKAAKNITDGGTDGYVIFAVSDVKADQFRTDTVTDTENEDKKYYRPTASFTNSETVFAYLTSQSYAENKIGRSEEGAG